MKTSLKLLFIICITIIALLYSEPGEGNKLLIQGNVDSLVHRTDNYIQYVNGIASHGTRFTHTYIKIAGHKKFLPAPGYGYWPDSIEQTVTIINYNNEPVEYAETPLNVPSGTNLEYDNYYYQGKILAYRIFEVINNSPCTGGALTNTFTTYYDSTGKVLETSHTLFGSKNEPIDTAQCPALLNDFSHLYKSYSETPLSKEGIEAKSK